MGEIKSDRSGEGYVFLADHRIDLIVRGGVNVYPAEIELVLAEHPDVASSIVIGLPCEELGERVHAIIDPQETCVIDLEAVHEFLAARITKCSLPETYEILHACLSGDTNAEHRTALRDERVMWLKEGRAFNLVNVQTWLNRWLSVFLVMD